MIMMREQVLMNSLCYTACNLGKMMGRRAREMRVWPREGGEKI